MSRERFLIKIILKIINKKAFMRNTITNKTHVKLYITLKDEKKHTIRSKNRVDSKSIKQFFCSLSSFTMENIKEKRKTKKRRKDKPNILRIKTSCFEGKGKNEKLCRRKSETKPIKKF